jgi:hypothetical protein
MLDKDLGDALLRVDLTPPTDPPIGQVERIIDTDRRHVKRWTRIAIAMWILAALGAMIIFVMGALTFPVIAKMIMKENQAKAAGTDVAAKALHAKNANETFGTLDNPVTPFELLAKLMAMFMVFGSASFLVLVFAGLATVLLLLRSRTATFRQINANLLQIAEQLKRTSPPQTGQAAT